MGYPFPDIKIKVYPKTFLKDVHIFMTFSEVALNDDVQNKAGAFFCKEFGLPNIKMEGMPKAVSVFSNERDISFTFGLARADMIIKREAYRSFADTQDLLNKYFRFLSAIGIDHVTKLSFSKYNELGYEAKEGFPVSEVMSDVFSKDLLTSMTKKDVETQKDLTRWEKVVHFEGKDDTDSSFTIEYGFRKLPVEKGRSSLTLKTIIESGSVNIATKDLHGTLSYYNQILDNAFHWCVSNKVLKAMEG